MTADVHEVPCPDHCEFRGQQHVHLESASTGQGQVWGIDYAGIPALLDPWDLQRDAPVRSPLRGSHLHAIVQPPPPPAEMPADLADVVAMVLTRHVATYATLLPPWSPLRNPTPAITPTAPDIPGACYKASFGWVHVKPGCRCERMTR